MECDLWKDFGAKFLGVQNSLLPSPKIAELFIKLSYSLECSKQELANVLAELAMPDEVYIEDLHPDLVDPAPS